MEQRMNYRVWGEHDVDEGSRLQMDAAMKMPVAVAGAVMPDAHVGYGLPIGGVLALENAVCPYGVGVDIACRMKISIFDLEPKKLDKRLNYFSEVLEDCTMFGVGKGNQFNFHHPVLEKDWSITQVTLESKEKAKNQLGTSGSGNHFVEWGVVKVREAGVLPVGEFIALMSHSGSRGPGAAVCNEYSRLARCNPLFQLWLQELEEEAEKTKSPRDKEIRQSAVNLGWLDLDSKDGQEYWAAMNLMGEFAKANHDCIHAKIAEVVGVNPFHVIENHHNFAWEEEHNGKKVIVHRKGATPAGEGELGVIPGSMGTKAFIVEGLGNKESLTSASHGAGRRLSRKKAKEKFNYRAEIGNLKARGITVLSAGADEVCGAYKDIEKVMEAQLDLVKPIAEFMPKIVKMEGGKDRAED